MSGRRGGPRICRSGNRDRNVAQLERGGIDVFRVGDGGIIATRIGHGVAAISILSHRIIYVEETQGFDGLDLHILPNGVGILNTAGAAGTTTGNRVESNAAQLGIDIVKNIVQGTRA